MTTTIDQMAEVGSAPDRVGDVGARQGRNAVWAVIITGMALFMASLDNLVVSTALPVIRVHLHTGLSGLESVDACRQRFSFDGNIVAESDGGVVIRAGAPHLSVGNRLAPDLAPADRGAMISNGDVGQSNSLRHGCALAGTRNIQLRGLTSVLELRAGVPCQRSASCQNRENTLRHPAHNRISSA